MTLDDSAAVALATILIAHDQEAGALHRQLPLHASDHGDTLLVKGTPYDDASKELSSCMSYVLFRKRDGEILDFGVSGRMELSSEARRALRAVMPRESFERMVGPRPDFVPDPSRPSPGLQAMRMIYGGLVNGSEVAKEYGAVLLEAGSRPRPVDRDKLLAHETAGVWHITSSTGAGVRELLTFERSTGRVLSPTP